MQVYPPIDLYIIDRKMESMLDIQVKLVYNQIMESELYIRILKSNCFKMADIVKIACRWELVIGICMEIYLKICVKTYMGARA